MTGIKYCIKCPSNPNVQCKYCGLRAADAIRDHAARIEADRRSRVQGGITNDNEGRAIAASGNQEDAE